MRNIDFSVLRKRPLSAITIILALFLIFYEMIGIMRGNLYEAILYYIDGTTLIELGILMLVGAFTLWSRTDLQAVSATLVACLSFIFMYEAIYKWSFYLTPFRWFMPPDELREFVIQAGIAATILTGFANSFFTLKKWTFIWLGLFVALWIFWLLVGFPQLTGEVIHPQVIPIHFTHPMTYVLNRITKTVLFFAYLTLFPPMSPIRKMIPSTHAQPGTQ